MAYVSNVIEQLQDDIARETGAVQGFLENSLLVASQIATASLQRKVVPSIANPTVPSKPSVPLSEATLKEVGLSFWDSIRWPLLSPTRRWEIIQTSARYAPVLAQYKSDYVKAQDGYKADLERLSSRATAHKSDVEAHNLKIASREAAAASGDRGASWLLSNLRLDAFLKAMPILPDDGHVFAYQEKSRRLLVEFVLPSKAAMPTAKSVRFLKTTGEHRYTYRSDAELKRLYVDFVAQAVLSVLNATFECTELGVVETVVVNAVLVAPDPATGRVGRIPLVSVSTSRTDFEQLDLFAVEAVACLKHLSAVVSRNPAEAVPVRPFLTFDKNDPRFVQGEDILSGLESRPNLLDLSPTEFESLIQNLFSAMGLDTKQTQASRDGGVDAVAYDDRPVLGGKVIIQAKRYKNTVGVSAVRDLFGAVMNEGASKGILVTTSGYGSASFEFAKNKPLELLDGTNLLFLLKEHAGLEARITVPEGWVEPDHSG